MLKDLRDALQAPRFRLEAISKIEHSVFLKKGPLDRLVLLELSTQRAGVRRLPMHTVLGRARERCLVNRERVLIGIEMLRIGS